MSTDMKLEVENLTKSYGEEVAVDNLSMSIENGHLKALLGPSGCGKTTTLRCIAGLEKPDSGRIYINDELVSAPEEGVHVPAERRDIGMVFQSYAVWPHMTVAENVRYPLKVKKIGSKAEQQEKVMDILERVDLEPHADDLATNLSGGQQQRVALARALVVEPDILLFDEPLSNLDAKLRRDMRIEIKNLHEEFNTTILYVTHAQDEAMFLSDRVALMSNGTIVEEGDPIRLHTEPKTFFGMNFMGQCNTYNATITGLEGGVAAVESALGRVEVDVSDNKIRVDEDVYLCFRPKSCRILTEGEQAEPTESTIEGTLRMRSATRDFVEYHVDVNGSSLLVRTVDPVPIQEDDPIRFAVDQHDFKVFRRSEGQSLVDAKQVAVADDQVPEQTSAAK